jgi:hypothetical protein
MPGTQQWMEINGIDSSKLKLTIECDHLVSVQHIEFDAEIR